MTRIIETPRERSMRHADEIRWRQAEKNRRLSVILGWLFYPSFIAAALWVFDALVEKTAASGVCFAVGFNAVIFIAMLIGAKIRGES